MTTDQVEYWKLQEAIRHNREQEQIAAEQNIIKDRDVKLKQAQIDLELSKANLQKEMFDKNFGYNIWRDIFSPAAVSNAAKTIASFL